MTAHPDTTWVTQQARNAAMDLNDRGVSVRFLLRDHDANFSRGFDDVLGSDGGQVLRTPIRAPKANAYAERWIQTVRLECLDWTLVLGRRHLPRLLRTYAVNTPTVPVGKKHTNQGSNMLVHQAFRHGALLPRNSASLRATRRSL